jgi:hypothetical protein
MKILATITVTGAKDEDHAIRALEHMLCTWDEHKSEWEGLERINIDITVRTIQP